MPEQRGEKAGCQFATLGCNDLMFNAVAPFAQFKRLFIKQEEGGKKKKQQKEKKTQKNKKNNNFYPSDTQESCSKLHVTNKKRKRAVLKCSYEV